MNWTSDISSNNSADVYSDLPTTVGKAGATESVAFVAIIWGVALIIAAASK